MNKISTALITLTICAVGGYAYYFAQKPEFKKLNRVKLIAKSKSPI